IVAEDLLTGILAGIGLSVAKLLYELSQMEIQVSPNSAQRRIDLHIHGAATFIRMAKFADTLDQLPRGCEIHIHLDGLLYIDHACIEAFSNWERKRIDQGGTVIVEWDELMAKSERSRIPAPPQLAEVSR